MNKHLLFTLVIILLFSLLAIGENNSPTIKSVQQECEINIEQIGLSELNSENRCYFSLTRSISCSDSHVFIFEWQYYGPCDGVDTFIAEYEDDMEFYSEFFDGC